MPTCFSFIIFCFIISLFCNNLFAQIGVNTTTPHINAAFEVAPTGAAIGVKFPEADSITRANNKPTANTAKGLMVYDPNKKAYFYWDGADWVELDEYDNTLRRLGFDPSDVAKEELVNSGVALQDADGTLYKTKVFNNKRWMIEDLRTQGGITYRFASNNYFYNYVPAGIEIVTYTLGYSNIGCPSGWHIPSRAEWEALFNYLQSDWTTTGDSILSSKLRNDKVNWASGIYTAIGNPSNVYGYSIQSILPSNSTGFSAIPSYGVKTGQTSFDFYDGTTCYVTTTNYSGSQFYYVVIGFGLGTGGSYPAVQFLPYDVMSQKAQIRCVKD